MQEDVVTAMLTVASTLLSFKILAWLPALRRLLFIAELLGNKTTSFEDRHGDRIGRSPFLKLSDKRINTHLWLSVRASSRLSTSCARTTHPAPPTQQHPPHTTRHVVDKKSPAKGLFFSFFMMRTQTKRERDARYLLEEIMDPSHRLWKNHLSGV
jgi:hypothetical protein